MRNIPARFVNLPPNRIDSDIEDPQRRICQRLDLDRSILWQVSGKEPLSLLMTHMYQLQGTSPLDLLVEELFPWSRQKFLAGEMVIFTKTSNLPPEA
jgi:hypothetical protein